jgi:hypothetical protein
MHHWAIVGALIAISAIADTSSKANPAFEQGHWPPTPQQIKELESHLPMAPPLGIQMAARYYYGSTVGGHEFIIGEILSPGDKPGIYISDNLPLVLDGGCSVINLTYDVKENSFVGYACNGMA